MLRDNLVQTSAVQKPGRHKRIATICALALSLMGCGEASLSSEKRDPGQQIDAIEADLRHDYEGALGKSVLFYEAQRSGADQSGRIPWRGPATLNDGADVGMDLSGGWYDAGDHVKFGLPMSYSAAVLAFSVYESHAAYKASGELDAMLDNLRFVNDYFLNAYDRGRPGDSSDDRLAIQVGDGHGDHGYWGAPEFMPSTMVRPTTLATANKPATEVAAGTAAAMAAASVVFKEVDAAYSRRLLDAAKELYEFASAYRGNDVYQEVADVFYHSYGGWNDELAWGATWLYLATGDNSYVGRAKNAIANAWISNTRTMDWDNVANPTAILLQRIAPEDSYERALDEYFRFWLPGGGVTRTPGGLAWLDQWGSLRYSANTAFLALVYAKDMQGKDADYAARLREFGLSQLNYILGDNPRNSSYVVGIGNNPPQRPHHRAAQCGGYKGDCNIGDPNPNRNVLVGAMVGGPERPDDFAWQDDRSNYITAEVATDYNAAYTGALAEVVALAGGSYEPPVIVVPEPPVPVDEPSRDDNTPSGSDDAADVPAVESNAPASQTGVRASVSVQNDWGTGACYDVAVLNDTNRAQTWLVNIPLEGSLTQVWNARYNVDGNVLTAKGVDWNAEVPAGGTAFFGYCVDK